MDIESQTLVPHSRREFFKWVPVMGLTVGFYSALFATFILYPWHIELSNEFANLKTSCDGQK